MGCGCWLRFERGEPVAALWATESAIYQHFGYGIGTLQASFEIDRARALVAMHDEPGKAWSLAEMAAVCGLSRSTFAARFKRVLGQTPAEHLVQWRLGIAQSRLRGGAPLKVVAAELGYGHASALSRVFTQKVGQSPRQWLRDGWGTAGRAP